MLVFAFMFIALPYLFQAEMVVKEYSLEGPYTAEDMENLVHWELSGSAELGGRHIRLTPDERGKQGAIWNNFPTFSNNWELQMQFSIHGKGAHVNGDGMAVWYVSEADRLKSGPVFGSKNFFSGLGVFIDTMANQAEPHKHSHPYISAMVNNGSLHYEHNEDGTFTQIGGCHAFVRNLLVPSRIAVSYTNNDLAVYLDNEGTGHWKKCFTAEGVYLPTGYYLGVSASTKDSSDNHDVISITYLNLDSEFKEFTEKNDIIPEAKNVQIPKKYHKDELQKIKEKEINEDEEEENEEDQEEEEIDIKENKFDEIKMKEKKSEESAPSSTSLLRKLVYITGAVLIIIISISTFRKYMERRRERMHKRLF